MTTYAEMKEQAEQNKTITNLTPEYRAWVKEGQTILGKFTAVGAVASSVGEGSYNQYVFDTDDGLVKFALGSAADKEFIAQLQIGGVYLIKYLGKVKLTGRRTVNKFELYLIAPPQSNADFLGGPDDLPY